ncbi:OmpA family protein [Actinomyces dentalis]|uniref:OmpA family protein n=1 Tax=Actinomyces dentalis TaxID=272548 RepID=UPI001FE1DCEB|nr:OmpA family protein [Actinomyces dentalis]
MRSVSRRSVLVGSVVVAGGTALGACTGSSSKGGGGAAGAPAGSGSSASAPAPASSPGAAGFRSGCSGVEWDLEAGPAVVRDGMTILRLSFSPVSENSASLGTRVFSTSDSSHVIGEIKLLSLAGSAVYPVIGGDAHPLSKSVSPGEGVELFPVFGAVPQDAGTVEAFLPNFGVVAGIPVVGEAEAGFDVAAALSGADPDTSKAGPYSIGSATFTADGSSNTRKDSASTTVTVSGDVTFASDSAELSGQADAVLASAVEQIKRFPSGGGLAITGHTDDVADDAHNQTLSEQRARAVSDRLKQLVDLSKWTVEATGKGEGEPRVPNDSDEHRQVNRRVEIVLTPSNPAEGEGSRAGASPAPAPASPAAGSGQMPQAQGPVGTGADGVDITIDSVAVHVWMEKVTRVGGYLVGELLMRTDSELIIPAMAFGLPGAWDGLGGQWMGLGYSVVSNLTLLSGDTHYLEAYYMPGSDTLRPLANAFTPAVKSGQVPARLPAVWPDTGQDAVVLDLPGGKKMHQDALCLRLTGIPVVEG